MKIYVFGNEDLPEDNLAFKVAEKFDGKFAGLEFIKVKLNEDLPFLGEKEVVILDTVLGIDKIQLIEDQDLEKINLSPRVSVHDFDLGFQLKYLKKLGKIGRAKVVGLPKDGEIDYDLIQSIFKKLVAQDMQGS